MGTLSHIINLFFLNDNSIDYLKNEVSWQKILGIFSLVQGIFFFISLIIAFFLGSIFGDFESTLLIMIAIIGFYLTLIFLHLLKACIVHVFLKLVGAKKDINETVKFNLAIITGMSIVGIPVLFISLLPIIGILINIAFIFYIFYVSLYVYSRVHDISKLRVFLAYLLISLTIGVLLGGIVAIAFQTWLNTYQAENFAKLNEQTRYTSEINFQYITEDTLNIVNTDNKEVDAIVRVEDCNQINLILTPGSNEIDLSNANCQNMDIGNFKSIKVIGDSNLFSFTGIIR